MVYRAKTVRMSETALIEPLHTLCLAGYAVTLRPAANGWALSAGWYPSDCAVP